MRKTKIITNVGGVKLDKDCVDLINFSFDFLGLNKVCFEKTLPINPQDDKLLRQ